MTNYDETLYRVGDFLNVKFETPSDWENMQEFENVCVDMENIGMTMMRHDRLAEPFGSDAGDKLRQLMDEMETANLAFEDAVWDCYNNEGDNEAEDHVDWIRDAAVECNEIKAKLDRFATFEVWEMGDKFTVIVDVDKYNETTGANVAVGDMETAVGELANLYAAIANGTFCLVDIWEDGEEREADVEYRFPVAEWEPAQTVIKFCQTHGYAVGDRHKVVEVDPNEVGDAA